jgi:hypothetical protein
MLVQPGVIGTPKQAGIARSSNYDPIKTMAIEIAIVTTKIATAAQGSVEDQQALPEANRGVGTLTLFDRN